MHRVSKHANREPVPWGTRIARTLFVLPFFVILLVGADLGLGLYDVMTDPATRTGGIRTPWQPLTDGQTVFSWSAPFRISGLQFALEGRRLRQQDLTQLDAGVTGELAVEMPGSGDTAIRHSFAFLLEPHAPVAIPTIEAAEPGTQASTSNAMALGVRYDLSCPVRPLEGAEAAVHALRSTEIPARQPLQVTLVLDGGFPPGLGLVMSYSKRPRSFLHGTFLGRVSARVARD